MDWSRRSQLKLLGPASLAPLLSGCAPSVPSEPEVSSLFAAAYARGLLFGSNSDARIYDSPLKYQKLFERHCCLFAPNFGWSRVNPQQSSWRLQLDPNTEYSADRHLKLSGGHLLWHYQTPKWLGSLDTLDATKAMVEYVSALVSHYRDQVYSWNVVNEALELSDGRADGLRNDTMLKAMGTNYIDLAFRTARAADPSAVLVYNDNRLETNTVEQESRRGALLRLLDDLQRKGTPIDAVGLQSHLKIGKFEFDEKVYRNFLEHIASRGLKIIITEFDVFDGNAPAYQVTRDQLVAEIYGRFLSVALDEPAVLAAITWGLSDKFSWLNLNPTNNPYLNRVDGLPNRPLPFDDKFEPKPAFFSLLNALTHAPLREQFRTKAL